ncbi:D-lactate dehydrogenase (cytochrome) [Deinococcus sp. HSC-46F16]|uniref:FAD-binding oxidoreductase n=1 Tax=Deinococcus sp. HSC-46F16 TaxID=2910968 RepID=UPI00209F334C|nr:FAD-linked oxidase C-terminal domain-containing protein [Deinococcus sp. HSC-46F16]MCP2014657.1 D-lactate dehydrogenase (cytochrome) [Deinococcus sp. HSC-46F16]
MDGNRRTGWGEALRSRLGGRVSLAPGDRSAHARDEGTPLTCVPGAVVGARSEGDVLETLAVAREWRVPVTPWGAGTSLEGAVLPVPGAISLDLGGLDAVGEPDPVGFTVTVGPGVRRLSLNRRLRPHGLFFPVDPGADASLGGMAATNASGTTTVRYGGMRENVAALRVALADGRVLTLGNAARKSSSGYALKQLFIGSEGTLGVITALTLRLHPLPPMTASVQLAFGDVEGAVAASVTVRGLGLSPERLEFVDAATVAAVNRHRARHDPEAPTLWVEVAGRDHADLDAGLALLREAASLHGGTLVGEARTPEAQTELWAARHGVYDALRAAWPGHATRIGDVCVPLSALARTVALAGQVLDEQGLTAPLVGHIGDGNLHLLMHAPPDDADAWTRIDHVLHALAAHAVAVGGTCTGEHGVGLRKRAYLRSEHGDALDVMREVKAMLDPLNLLNPGKVVGDPALLPASPVSDHGAADGTAADWRPDVPARP